MPEEACLGAAAKLEESLLGRAMSHEVALVFDERQGRELPVSAPSRQARGMVSTSDRRGTAP